MCVKVLLKLASILAFLRSQSHGKRETEIERVLSGSLWLLVVDGLVCCSPGGYSRFSLIAGRISRRKIATMLGVLVIKAVGGVTAEVSALCHQSWLPQWLG